MARMRTIWNNKKSARKYLHMNIECGVYTQWIFIFVLYK